MDDSRMLKNGNISESEALAVSNLIVPAESSAM